MLRVIIILFIFLSSPLKAEVTTYDSWDIPEYVKPDPNLETLKFYLKRQIDGPNIYDKWNIQPSKSPTPFSYSIRKNAFLTKQMETTSIVSYLFFDNGEIVYDEKSPSNRLGNLVNDETKLLSNSMGKSLVSYVTGHAICRGHIKDTNVKLDDWPLIKDTLYADLRLIDVLDMRARDDKFVDDLSGMISSGRWYNIHPIKSFAERELKNSKPSAKLNDKYRYNGLATNIVMNYTIHKSGADFQNILNEIFQNKAGIEHSVFFLKNKWQRSDDGRLNQSAPMLTDDDGRAWYQFYASRYDYLRIATAILNDWKNDTCVGKYLKKIHKGRKPKNIKTNHPRLKYMQGYGGQFHTNATGMTDRNIMAMEGYGGQAIMIDFDNSRIVVLNTVHTNFDWYELVLQPIKNGNIRN